MRSTRPTPVALSVVLFVILFVSPTVAAKCAAPALALTYDNVSAAAGSLMTGNSSILAGFYEKEVIPSASWSVTNSTLCLGCIDNGAYTGDFHTFKYVEPKVNASLSCALQVKIEQIYWYPKSGVEGTFLVKNGFQACVDPGIDYLVYRRKY